jgi:type IV pilus assembly protein PilM
MLFGSNKTVVGLDVGSYAVKAVALQAVKGRITLQGYAMARVADQDPAEVVRQVLDRLGVRSRRYVTSVSGRSVIVRQVETPRLDGDPLRAHISAEADKFIPFGAEEVVLDCQPLDPEGKGQAQQVMLVAVRRSLIADHLGSLKAAGVQPEVIDVDVFALANAYELLGPPVGGDEDKRATALVDIGASKTNIAIVRAGKVLFTREIYLAGNEISDAIARSLNEPAESVDAIKTAPGDALDQVIDAAMPAFEDLANEIRLSFDYVEGQFDTEVAAVVLTGGSSQLPNAAAVLGNILGRAVHVFDPMAGLDLVPSKYDVTSLDANSPSLTVALGLALHQLDIEAKGLGGSQSHGWQPRSAGGGAVVGGLGAAPEPAAAYSPTPQPTVATQTGTAAYAPPAPPPLAPPPPILAPPPAAVVAPPPMLTPPPVVPTTSILDAMPTTDRIDRDGNRSGLLVVLDDDQDMGSDSGGRLAEPGGATHIAANKPGTSKVVKIDAFEEDDDNQPGLPKLPDLPKL